MKTLLSTTALMIALGLPTLTMAQATAPAANPAKQQQSTGTSGFLAQRSETDVFGTELIGHDVHARRAPNGTQDSTMMNGADLEAMDNIGQINDIVLSKDGQVRALVIGVGGFLGLGEQNVAVTMDQVTFASDVEDRSQMYIIVNTAAETLKTAPAYARSAAIDNTATDRSQKPRTERRTFVAPEMAREGYVRVEATEVTTEMLIGQDVYGVDDNDVGTVTDMVIDDAGTIGDVIIDFGGFLGMGKSQAALGFDELTILSTEGNDDVRIYVDATKDQIQNLPKYQAAE